MLSKKNPYSRKKNPHLRNLNPRKEWCTCVRQIGVSWYVMGYDVECTPINNLHILTLLIAFLCQYTLYWVGQTEPINPRPYNGSIHLNDQQNIISWSQIYSWSVYFSSETYQNLFSSELEKKHFHYLPYRVHRQLKELSFHTPSLLYWC